MSGEITEGLRPELLDDFYAECDELLETSRAALTQFEAALPAGRPTTAPVDALFRATHSLKGICAIAGVRPAEELAHGIEDLLRAVTRGEVAVTPAIADAFLVAFGELAKMVAAHRQRKPLPTAATALHALRTYLPAAAKPKIIPAPLPAPATPTDDNPVAAARARGLGIWRVVFSP